ncbi:MAG: S1C family serine protease [Sphingomonadaceae bacterium]
MKRLLVGLTVVVGVVFLGLGSAMAESKPEFRLGFKALSDQIPDVVGDPLENEHWGTNGDSLQRTSKGLMVWRKADNWTAFTNGAETWINGPEGLQSRPNDQRFPWENDPVSPQGTEYAPVIINGIQARDGSKPLVWINGLPCQDPSQGGTNCYSLAGGTMVRAGGRNYRWLGGTSFVDAGPYPTASQPSGQQPPVPQAVPPVSPAPAAATLQEAAQLMRSYTIAITTNNGKGSGVSLGSGRILTAAHVVTGATNITIWSVDGQPIRAQLAGIDLARDLALLLAPSLRAPAAPIGDSSGLKLGDTILVLGYPRPDAIGMGEPTLTQGILSSRKNRAGVEVLQTDAAINPGNSGGPVADGAGRLVGIADFIITEAEGLNFAVAGTAIKDFLSGPQGLANSSVPYQMQSFGVPADKWAAYTWRLATTGAALEGYFTVSGDKDVGFRITGPSDSILLDPGRVEGPYAFGIRSTSPGPHTLYFDNTYSIFTTKNITLFYRVH